MNSFTEEFRHKIREYLINHGVKSDNIISFELDKVKDLFYRNPLELALDVRKRVENKNEEFYLFIDEIQMSDEVPNPYNPEGRNVTFNDALNDLKSLPNLDIYVTGSNSKIRVTLFRLRERLILFRLKVPKRYTFSPPTLCRPMKKSQWKANRSA
ncbi:MAG: AAA family ATPase [Clostridiales bacterium]|nr:AAA family ATPase [Clostridiales bacterium]